MEQILPGGAAVSLIHLVRFDGRIACMLGLTEADLNRLPQHTVMRSNDLRAVNCKACQQRGNGL